MRPLLLLALLLLAPVSVPAAEFPKFKTQEIDTGLKIGYAVLVADINGDKKPDIVVVDQHKVVWYENPGEPGGEWKKRVILDGKTRPDNVCAAAVDIDGDGLPEIVLGSAWKPFDTTVPAQLTWLKRGKTLDEEWTMHTIPCEEPTIHRIRVIENTRDGKPRLVSVPLMGRDATQKANWMDGRPVRITSYPIPANPEKPESWKPEVICEELHVAHNFCPLLTVPRKNEALLVANYEGVSTLQRDGEKWVTSRIGEGNQANPKGNRGSSEIKQSGDKLGIIATIEPWHGNQVVTYTPGEPGKLWERHVVDEQLRWGHAVWFADLDGDGIDELIIGVRDDPNPKAGDLFTERRGVRIYKNVDGKGTKWERMILENGGVAVEDLAAADLDGDGKIDIVAVGRATGNCRIYWNQGR
jgi:hypothetical protein